MGAKITEPPQENELHERELHNATAEPSARRTMRSEAVTEGDRRAEIRDIPAGPPKSLLREYFESAVVTIIMALFGMTFIVQAVKVPTGSMQNTINIGDQLLVNKFIFAPGPVLPFLPQREIWRGDVIVFKYPGNPHDTTGRDQEPDNIPYRTNYVKRVIGLPGDTVEVRGEDVYVNGELLPERHASVVSSSVGEKPALDVLEDTPMRGTGTYTVYNDVSGEELSGVNYAREGQPDRVPDGQYFVMGDNRDNSADGRVWGFVPRELVVGRAMFVYWSYDMSDQSNDNPLGKFLRNSRWNRTGTMIK
jgi:signal peptidase I